MAPSPAVHSARIAVALTAAIVAISTASLLIRLSTSPPNVIAMYRLGYATLLLLPLAWRERPQYELRDATALLSTGAVLALHFVAWIASIAPASPYATSVAASTVLVTTHPVFVALVTPHFLRERVSARAWWGIAIGIAGAAIIAMSDASAGNARLIGDALAVVGAMAAAAYFLVGRKLRTRMGVFSYVVPVYGSAAALTAVFVWLRGEALWVPSLREHVLFLCMAVGPMMLGHTLLNWALGHAPAQVVSTTVLAEPVVSVALVALVRGEQPTARVVLGGIVVLAGVALGTRAPTSAPVPRASLE